MRPLMNGLTKALMTSVAMTSNKDTLVLAERGPLEEWGGLDGPFQNYLWLFL